MQVEHAPEAGSARGREFAVGVLLAVLGLGLATLPAAARAAERVPFLAAWVFAWAGTGVLLAPFAGALRAGRLSGRPLLAVTLALVGASAPLAIVAEVLKRTTHHRALGAATFSLVGLGIVVGALAFAGRALGPQSTRWRARAATAAVALSGLGMMALAARAAGSGDASRLLPHMLDGTLIVGSLALAGGLRRPRRVPGWLAALCWVALLALGLAAGLTDPRIPAVMRNVAPVAAGVGSLTPH